VISKGGDSRKRIGVSAVPFDADNKEKKGGGKEGNAHRLGSYQRVVENDLGHYSPPGGREGKRGKKNGTVGH